MAMRWHVVRDLMLLLPFCHMRNALVTRHMSRTAVEEAYCFGTLSKQWELCSFSGLGRDRHTKVADNGSVTKIILDCRGHKTVQTAVLHQVDLRVM